MKKFNVPLGLASVLTFLATTVFIAPAFAANEVTNAAALREKLGLTSYAQTSALAGLKIAILDNGFSGFAAGRGLLPDSAELIAGPQNAPAASAHGLGMAQIVWAMTGKHAEGPKFYLVNTNGFTNFKAAIDFVIREKIDLVLYSQVWPFGSNFDGKGFINEAVNRATGAGILWINAAGNFGQMAYQGSVKKQLNSDTRLLRFGDKDYVSFDNRVDENELTVTLSWTDFQDSESHNTIKDLDLLIYDSKEKLVGSSKLIQRGEAPPAQGTSNLSSHAREAVTLANLDRGSYRIRVAVKSENFVEADLFRVLLQSEKPGSIEFKDHTSGNEIFAPADNPNVITVGEVFEASAQGPTADGRIKPDVLIDDAIVSFSNGTTVRGSSSAAAIFTGVIAVLKSARSDFTQAGLWSYLHTLQIQAASQDDLTPASPTAYPPIPNVISELVPTGGKLMIHRNGHFVVFSPVDPLELPQFRAGHAYRQHADDVLVLQPYEKRWYAVPRAEATSISGLLVEFRLMYGASGIWRTPAG